MTRELRPIDAIDPLDVFEALREALTADGPAIAPFAPDAAASVRATVPQRVALVVETSGSAGTPKQVALSADALLASASASESALGGPGQWLLALPVHYIAGIQVLTRSLTSRTDPVILPPGRFNANEFAARAASMDAPLRFTSLVPVQLARLIEADETLEALRRFDRILVGGQALSEGLQASALELGLNITRTYGASETCGGCVYDGVPIGTTEVDVVEGQVELSGLMLAEGYLGDPARTENAFYYRDGIRRYRTGDTGVVTDDVLHITGRIDDVIVSGGIKVSLAAVERAVNRLPGLEQAVVVAAPDIEWGEVPVVVADRQVDLALIRREVANTLGAAARPTRVLVVGSIPILTSGKPDRRTLWALAAK